MRSKGSIRSAALLCGATLALAVSSAMAQSTEMPQQVIIGWKPTAQLTDGTVSAAATLRGMQDRFGISMRSMRRLSTGGEVIRLSQRLTDAQLQDLIANLSKDDAVAFVEEDRILKANFTPNDPGYAQQWHYFEATGGLNLPLAWDITSGAGIRVAVIDTGIRPHADLAGPGGSILTGNLVAGYDFISDTFVSRDGGGRDADPTDPGDFSAAGECGAGTQASGSSWHGTHVSGTVAAITNNASGVAGVAFSAKVVPVRALGRCGGLTSDIADAITWASGGTVAGVPNIAARAQVLNLSLGGGGACGVTTQNAINGAVARGTVVVVAAGNENQNASNATPANCQNVVTVGATNRAGGRAFYSNFGAAVDVSAPGGELTAAGSANGVLSTLNQGATTPGVDAFAFYQGTSMATPHVAGAVALVMSRNSALTPAQVESLLKSTSRPLPIPCNLGCGAGIVNALAAVQAAAGGPQPIPPGQLTNGVPVTGLSGALNSERRFTLVVPAGATNMSIAISGGTGDADLYVRRGTPPTTTTFDCRPFRSGNNETCSAAAPTAGTYHILIRGFSAYSGVTLRGSFQ
jgi:serine protease